MGKRLIIKGADFSEDAISVWKDITNKFTSWSTGAYSINNGNATASTSSVFNKCEKVDISEYQGKEIYFTNIKYNSASGAISEYGITFYNSSGTFIQSATIVFPLYSNNTADTSKGATYYDTAIIPSNAKLIGVTYFKDEQTVATIDSPMLPFKLMVRE